MARRKPAYILQRQADQAKAREAYNNNRNLDPETFNATVESLPRIGVGYRSLNVKIGDPALPANLLVQASESAVKWFEGVAETGNLTNAQPRLGLFYEDLGDFLPVTKFDVSKIHAVLGAPNPTAKRTPWGTRYISYTRTGEGNARSSYTAPISIKTGAITGPDLAAAAQAIANQAALKTAVGEYGRMWLEPESESYTLDTD